MEIFILCMLFLISLVNLFILASASLILVKIFELLNSSKNGKKPIETGLVDIATPQIPYNLRP